jgi:DNA helicase-2/ATP-dependent DNA helicase PcrA
VDRRRLRRARRVVPRERGARRLFVASEESAACSDEEGFRFRDVAVFYRTNAQSRDEDVFMRVSMPYRVFGGVRFFQRREVKDVLGYLRPAAEPRRTISVPRVVNMPKRGSRDQTVAALRRSRTSRRSTS